jgi:hypothetical protein
MGNFQHWVLWLDGASVAWRTSSRRDTAPALGSIAPRRQVSRTGSSYPGPDSPGAHAVSIDAAPLVSDVAPNRLRVVMTLESLEPVEPDRQRGRMATWTRTS